MISSRHIFILISALIASFGFGWLGYIRGEEINVYLLFLSFIASVLYVPLVIKLPIFKSYYVTDSFKLNKTHHNFANSRGAPVMVGLVVGVSLGVALYFTGAPNPGYHSFCGAVSGVVVSFIYEPKF